MLILNADGGCFPNPGQGSYGFVAKRDGRVLYRKSEQIGYATNNIAEWRGALAALDYAIGYTIAYQDERAVTLLMDSQLVVHQLTGRWRTKNAGLKPLQIEGAKRVQALREQGVTVTVRWVPRAHNHEADALTGRPSTIWNG